MTIRVLDKLYLLFKIYHSKISFHGTTGIWKNKYPYTKRFQIDTFYEIYIAGNRIDIGIIFNPYKKQSNSGGPS
jgi:hypothetical protein